MFARFFCALFGFRACKFTAKFEGKMGHFVLNTPGIYIDSWIASHNSIQKQNLFNSISTIYILSLYSKISTQPLRYGEYIHLNLYRRWEKPTVTLIDIPCPSMNLFIPVVHALLHPHWFFWLLSPKYSFFCPTIAPKWRTNFLNRKMTPFARAPLMKYTDPYNMGWWIITQMLKSRIL